MNYAYILIFVGTKSLSFQGFITASISAFLIVNYEKQHLVSDYFATCALAHFNCP